jgi:hypothetical protein
MLLIGTLRWQCLSEYYLKFWFPLRVVSELLWNQPCDENGGPQRNFCEINPVTRTEGRNGTFVKSTLWRERRAATELLWNQPYDENGGPHQKHDIPNKLDGFQQNDGFSYFRALNDAISRGSYIRFKLLTMSSWPT